MMRWWGPARPVALRLEPAGQAASVLLFMKGQLSTVAMSAASSDGGRGDAFALIQELPEPEPKHDTSSPGCGAAPPGRRREEVVLFLGTARPRRKFK